jgi:hypothetical protein
VENQRWRTWDDWAANLDAGDPGSRLAARFFELFERAADRCAESASKRAPADLCAKELRRIEPEARRTSHDLTLFNEKDGSFFVRVRQRADLLTGFPNLEALLVRAQSSHDWGRQLRVRGSWQTRVKYDDSDGAPPARVLELLTSALDRCLDIFATGGLQPPPRD